MTAPFRFSARTAWGGEANPLSRLLERKRAEGRPILDLTVSNPTACGIRSLDARFTDALSDPANMRYEPEPRGLLSAREAVVAYYAERGVFVTADAVFLMASTSEAYTSIFRLVAAPGDSVWLPTPSYPLFDDLLRLADLRAERYALRYDGGWSVDGRALASAGPARAIITVNPNNPTGHYVSSRDREELNRFVRERDACLISDEVFLDYPFDGKPRGASSLASNGDVLTFTLGGISKAAALPQMKLAWIVVSGPAADKAEAVRRLEHIADTFLSAATPPQRALAAWMALSREVRAEISARVRENLDVLLRYSGQGGARLLTGEGGWNAVLAVDGDDQELALELLDRQDVLVHPGYLFDFEGDRIVVSLLTEPHLFQKAADRLWKRSPDA